MISQWWSSLTGGGALMEFEVEVEDVVGVEHRSAEDGGLTHSPVLVLASPN